MQSWRAPGSSREYDRRDLPQPPAPGACFPAYRSCEPVNSSYINSCCLLTYCRERRSWPCGRGSALGAAPPSPHRTWGEGEERWASPPPQGLLHREGRALGPNPCLPQSREPPLPGSPSWASVAGRDQAWGWKTGRGREAGRLRYPPPPHTHTQHTHTLSNTGMRGPRLSTR